jgi:hypothetical protein
MRVSNGVILSEGRSARVVKALLGAALSVDEKQDKRDVGGRLTDFHSIDVVNISFGRRSPDEALEGAVALAERHGIIVVAATGEYPFWSPVRFPAQYPTVVGATGTKVDGQPWGGIFGAGRGKTAFIAAPALNVWHPSTKVIDGQECYTANMGKGTSFSSPLVAASAALWLEYWTKEKLRRHYQREGVPAAFRYVLWHSGFRTPEELCQLAREERWPNAGKDHGGDGVCSHRYKVWGKSWGRGILAVDKLIAAPLPTAREVCDWIYYRDGENAWDRACPMGSEGRDNNLLLSPPAPARRERITRLAGASMGQPFSKSGGAGPAVDFGVIFSEHHYHSPKGVLVQGQVGAPTNYALSVGWGWGIGYDPFRDSKQSVSVIPGFGPALGFAIKGTYMSIHRDDAERARRIGPQLQLAVLKIKFGVGLLRDIHQQEKRWHWTWEAGFGF